MYREDEDLVVHELHLRVLGLLIHKFCFKQWLDMDNYVIFV